MQHIIFGPREYVLVSLEIREKTNKFFETNGSLDFVLTVRMGFSRDDSHEAVFCGSHWPKCGLIVTFCCPIGWCPPVN
jgi:hypothetical protein